MLIVLTFNLMNILNGIIHLSFWNCPLLFYGYQDKNLSWSANSIIACSDVQVGLTILLAKANHFRFQQDKG